MSVNLLRTWSLCKNFLALRKRSPRRFNSTPPVWRRMLAEHRPPRGHRDARPDPHPEEQAIVSRARTGRLCRGVETTEPQGDHACPAATVAPGARVSTGAAVGRRARGRPLWSLRSGPAGAYDF